MNISHECDICGSVDFIYDELSSELLCQVCGAVIPSERIQIDSKTAEYQRSFIATTSIEPTQEHVKVAVKDKIERKDEFDIQKFTLRLAEKLHKDWGLPNIETRLTDAWNLLLNPSSGASSFMGKDSKNSWKLNIGFSLLLLAYTHSGCAIVTNDLIKWAYQGLLLLEDSQLKLLVSAGKIESAAAPLSELLCFDMQTNREKRFKNFVFRCAKDLCLPKSIAAMAIDFWNNIKKPKEILTHTSIYGHGRFGYPVPVEAASALLLICRFIWPLFSIPPQAQPLKPLAKPKPQEYNMNSVNVLDFSYPSSMASPNINGTLSGSQFDSTGKVLLELWIDPVKYFMYKPLLCSSFAEISSALSMTRPDDSDARTPSRYVSFKKFIVDFLHDNHRKLFFKGLHDRFYNYMDNYRVTCNSDTWLKQRGYSTTNPPSSATPNLSNQLLSRLINRFLYSDSWSIEGSLSIYGKNENVRLLDSYKSSHWSSLAEDIYQLISTKIKKDKRESDEEEIKLIPKEAFDIVQNIPLNNMQHDIFYNINNLHTTDRLGSSTIYLISIILLANLLGYKSISIHKVKLYNTVC